MPKTDTYSMRSVASNPHELVGWLLHGFIKALALLKINKYLNGVLLTFEVAVIHLLVWRMFNL